MSIFLYKQTKTSEEVSPSLPFDYKVQLKVIARSFFFPMPCRNSRSKSIDFGKMCRNMMELNVGLVSPIHLHKYITLGIKEPVH